MYFNRKDILNAWVHALSHSLAIVPAKEREKNYARLIRILNRKSFSFTFEMNKNTVAIYDKACTKLGF